MEYSLKQEVSALLLIILMHNPGLTFHSEQGKKKPRTT